MPRTKPKAGSPPQHQPQSASANRTPEEVLTLAEAAVYLRLPEADVLRLVDEQALPARRLGNEWRFLREAIRDWMRAGMAPRSNKDAWMALAGAWKDDPHLAEVLQEIHNQRERADGPG